MEKLSDWSEIKSKFNSTIILGNGASIAVHKEFKYQSLYEVALSKKILKDPIKKIFDFYRTRDFELILRHLWYASIINNILKIGENKTTNSYELLRAALIYSIKEIHATYEDVLPHISRMYKFLKKFKKVISLNYDILVYWAMRTGNDKLGNWFKDCFLDGKFQGNWRWMEDSATEVGGSTLVFYPHGSLFLAKNRYDEEFKLARGSDNEYLLDSVIGKWESGDYIPLFVSEGDSSQKIKSINRSFYLSSVYYDVLLNLGKDIVIYGWSLDDNDNHILSKIAESSIEKIALSIYCKDKDEETIEEVMIEKAKKIKTFLPHADLFFFDAQSSNCWIY